MEDLSKNDLMPYFTIHSVLAINNKSYSIVRANILNTPEQLKIAKELYDNADDWHFEFHAHRYDMRVRVS